MPMAAIDINHVTIHADNLAESVRFYTEVLEFEEVQAPNLGNPLAWLRCGDQQLHVVERDTEPPRYHHFGLTVDDFERVFKLAKEHGSFDDRGDRATHQGQLYELPDGVVQLYLRDPAGNMVEVNWPDVTTLDESIQDQVIDRSEQYPQSEAQSSARLL